MKIPAVAIAASFLGGILLGLYPLLSQYAASRSFLLAIAICCAFILLLGLILATLDFLRLAALSCLLSWVALGTFASCIAQQPLPTNHILQRIKAGEINLKSPLRWHGHLTDEPSRLPWGYSVDIALTGVEAHDMLLPVRGGMRLGFTPNDHDPQFPVVHAGDEISVLMQARLPLLYRDAGAFDRRAFLARQNIDVIATLRSSKLLEVISTSPPSLEIRLAQLRYRLHQQVDNLFPASPQTAGILRAMLLGDRSFIDRGESVDYQKTGVFHVLVVAGLHVGALAFFLYWLFRQLRLPQSLAIFLLLALLLAYIAVVEQRPPVLRAGLMTALVVLGGFFHRRLDLLNSAALAALILLIAKPKSVLDSSFQLSFLAIGCIAGIALPWMERHVQPYAHALRAWRDPSRDSSYDPRRAQFRLDLRSVCPFLTSRFSVKSAAWLQNRLVSGFRSFFRISELLVLSFVLQLGMLPLMARDFHRIPLLGPIANLLVVPLTGIIVPLGFFGVGASLVLPWIARLCSLPLIWLVTAQNHIVYGLSRLSACSYRIPGPPAWVLFMFFGAALLLAIGQRMLNARRRWLKSLGTVGVLAGAALVASYPFAPTVIASTLEVTVLDVAQGDSILVVSPRGSTLLIDAGGAFQGFRGREEHLGPDPGEDAVSPYLWSRGFKTLNAVAVTHAHQDHIGGLTAILQNFRVGRVWLGNDNAAPALTKLKTAASQLHVPVEHELRGQSFVWDGVQVDFLWPEPEADESAAAAKNNDSLVVRLHYGKRTILLPGDAEKQAEYSMLSENDAAALQADVIKIGHHGSKNSSMPEFLAAVSPQIAIISAGEENPYGHPSPELLQRLQESGIRILRTDHDGAVQIQTDGRSLNVSCFVPCLAPSNAADGVQVPDNHQPRE